MPPADEGALPARRRALLATLGSGADLFVRQGAQLLVAVVLARLLSPAEFGAVALLGLLVTVGTVVADLGLTTALLQAEDSDGHELSACLSLTLLSGLLTTVVVAALSWPVSALFGLTSLGPVASFMSLGVLAATAGLVPTAVLIRQAAFGRLLAAGLMAQLVAGTIAILMARDGAGVWALAALAVAAPALGTLAAFGLSPVHIRPRWDAPRFRKLLDRGQWVLAANAIDTAWTRAQYGVIGSLFGTAPLGFYQRADTTQQLANDAASTVVGRVALPLFARATGSIDLLRTGYLTGVGATTAFAAPVMVLLAALAEPLLVTVFGAQWGPSGPILSILCLGGLLWPLHLMAINVLYARSLNRTVFRIDVVKKVLAVLLLLLGVNFGVAGVAWASVAFGLFAVIVNGRAVQKVLHLRIRQQIAPAVPSLLLACAVGSMVAVGNAVWAGVPVVKVMVLGGAGLVTYLLMSLALRTPVLEVLQLLRHRGESGDD